MPELHVPAGGELFVHIAPAKAIALTLPMAELAPRFPGIDPWLAQLPARLGRAARMDLRLLCVPLSGLLSYLFEAPDDEESIDPALKLLAAAPTDDLLERVFYRLSFRVQPQDTATVRQWLEHEPERLIAAIKAMEGPHPDEAFALDAERAIALMRRPEELRAMVDMRLRQLWHDHLAPRWQEALPTCRALAQAARRQFHLADPLKVLTAIVGRKGEDRYPLLQGKRLHFVPVPWLGPYIATAVMGGRPDAVIGFGIIQGEHAGDEETQRDLLASLKALADEPRLGALAFIRQYPGTRAADLMERFGWSQPATSRHLRALESVGLVRSEWVDRVKRYSVDRVRARTIAQTLEHFLTKE